MITTTLAVLALAGGLGSETLPSIPSWDTDYARAMTRASGERKPLAVFIGHGADNCRKMLADGKIQSDAAKLLGSSYVCVYLDTDTSAGKDLAGRFELQEGLIISSPGGSHQAYRHTGTVSGADLTQKLTQYASAGQPTTTVAGGVVIGTYSAPSYTVVPSGQYVRPATYYPTYGYQTTYGGTCYGPR